MLEVRNACKTFLRGTVNEQVGLAQLSLTLTDGEFITIIGSNGAGKSTLFNAIGGVFLLDRGRILLDGLDITFMKEHKRALSIGRIFQDPMKGTAPDLTVAENLALAFNRRKGSPLRQGVHRSDIAFFQEALMEFEMGLENRMQTKVGQLSGGQRQALSLLMTTIAKPKLLLLDEHTAALDPAAAEKIMAITKRIVRRDKITTMMITHNIHSALTTGSRTIMLEEGSILLDITGQDRDRMTVPEMMALYAQKRHRELDNDRMLLTRDEEA